MLFWFALALMTGSAVALVLWPLARPATIADETATDAAFYRAQIAEIERDAERGLLAPDEAESSRAEAARRLLGAARRAEGSALFVSRADTRHRLAIVLALLLIPVLSVGLYLSGGSPQIADQPLASRETPGDKPDIDQAVAQMEAHLARNPNDGRGFELIAPVYLQLGRSRDAANAFGAVIRILGETPQRLADFAEALIIAGEGVVPADARAALDKSLAGDPKSAKARFYRAQSYEQDGENEKALRLYRSLQEEAPAGSGLAMLLADKIARLGAAPPDSPATIAGVPQDEQSAMIRSMVERLSARLADHGADAEGWIRLMRSYMVLGEPAKAAEALERARAALSGDSAGRERVETFARDLKIGG